MTENELAKIVVDAAYRIHVKLGPGLLESVYEVVLAHELRKLELQVDRQVPISIAYDNMAFDEGFRADLLVENKLLIELKSVEQVKLVHKKQVLSYLKLAGFRLGLLINFGEAFIRDGIERIVNGLDDERQRLAQRRQGRKEGK